MAVEKVTVSVEVCKEAHALGAALETLVKNYKAAVADGFQPMQDIPAILLASMNDLLSAFGGIAKLGPEFHEELAASLNGVLLPVIESVGLLIKK